MRCDPTLDIVCDKCGTVETVGLTALAGGGYDERNVTKDLERLGWVYKDVQDFCDMCAEGK